MLMHWVAPRRGDKRSGAPSCSHHPEIPTSEGVIFFGSVTRGCLSNSSSPWVHVQQVRRAPRCAGRGVPAVKLYCTQADAYLIVDSLSRQLLHAIRERSGALASAGVGVQQCLTVECGVTLSRRLNLDEPCPGITAKLGGASVQRMSPIRQTHQSIRPWPLLLLRMVRPVTFRNAVTMQTEKWLRSRSLR